MQEERCSLREKSDRMVTLTPVHISQFYVNERGEKKPGKSGIALEIQEFNKLVKLIPKVQDGIARYKLRDTGISSSPLELDIPVLDLDPLFLPSPPSQEPIPFIQNEELLFSQPKCPSSPPFTFFPDVTPPLSVEEESNLQRSTLSIVGKGRCSMIVITHVRKPLDSVVLGLCCITLNVNLRKS